MKCDVCHKPMDFQTEKVIVEGKAMHVNCAPKSSSTSFWTFSGTSAGATNQGSPVRSLSQLRMEASLTGECRVCHAKSLTRVGDTLQSCAARMAAYLDRLDVVNPELPYEVNMAVIEARDCINEWTEIRKSQA